MFEPGVVEGSFLGMPVRFDTVHAFNNFWNPDDARMFPPTNFGFGWDVNFHAVAVQLGLARRRAR
jgi:hypothetical protein